MSADVVAARPAPWRTADVPVSCIVVGAGPAGLSAAWWLRHRGVKTTVLEAAAHTGGRTRTVRLHGSTLNTGAAFLTSFYSDTLGLCRRLGIPLATPRVHPTRAGVRRLMVTPRGLVPYAPGTLTGFARFSPVPMRQRLRLLNELVKLARGPSLHIADPASLTQLDDADAHGWAVEHLGTEACDYFVRPAIEPFFYTRAEDVSPAVARALLRHAMRWSIVAPRQGMGALCATLAAGLDVRFDRRVLAIAGDGTGVEVEHTRGRMQADAVVLAVPAPDLLDIVGGTTTPHDRADVAGARFEPCVATFLGYERPPALPAASITIGGPGPHALVGATALGRGSTPGLVKRDSEVVAILAMGWRSRFLLNVGSDEVVAALRTELQELGVALPDPAWTHVVARPHATVVPEPGFTHRLKRLAARDRGRVHLAGDWTLGTSTIEGAIRSGLAAARAVVARRGAREHVAS